MTRFEPKQAFSLVEVVVALGICTFALLTIVALVPVGIQTNHVSVEETEAIGTLTALEADLRNTHPLAGQSNLFHLTLPYSYSNGHVTLNPDLIVGQIYTTGLNQAQALVPVNSVPPPPYQATVIYTRVPSAPSAQPIEGHLIVNWPAISSSNPADLTNPSKVAGFVEGYVTFPQP